MEESRWLSELVGGEVRLKAENLQRTGSFKARGAYVRIARLTPEERARGVVAASAGNHAQGVALAARLLGISATVFMPEGAPIPKERATRGYGAEVVFSGQYLEDALVSAHEFAERTGAVLIHPFDHPDVVAGQGTVGLEIMEQLPEVATVVVPTGGGGLLAGVALAVKALRPDVRVVGVQAKDAAAYPGSLAAGRPTPLAVMRTMADGIAVGRPGDLTFAAVRRPRATTCSPSARTRWRERCCRWPSAPSWSRAGRRRRGGRPARPPRRASTAPVVAVLSGGNIDPLLLGKVIRHGMAAAGRYLNLDVTIPDAPGGLARLLTEVSAAGANVLEVAHERISPALSMDEVEVHLQLETRGSTHSDTVLARLREHGYRVLE